MGSMFTLVGSRVSQVQKRKKMYIFQGGIKVSTFEISCHVAHGTFKLKESPLCNVLCRKVHRNL